MHLTRSNPTHNSLQAGCAGATLELILILKTYP